MSEKKHKNFSSQFKAKVALEAIRGVKTVTEIAQAFGVYTRPKSDSGKKNSRSMQARYLIPNVVRHQQTHPQVRSVSTPRSDG